MDVTGGDGPYGRAGTTGGPAAAGDEGLHAAMVELMPVGLAYADAAGTIVRVNQRWRDLVDHDAPLPWPVDVVLDLIHPADRDRVVETYRSQRDAGEISFRLRVNRSADDPPHVALVLRRIPEDVDPTIRWACVATDVTPMATALEEVRRSEERFRGLTTSLPIAVFRTDPGGDVTWANPWLVEMSGYDIESFRGTSAFDVVHPEEREWAYLRALEAMSAGQPFEAEHRFLCRDGTYRWMITRVTPVRDERGRVLEFVGTMEDVTDLHSLTEGLAHAAAHDPLTRLPNRATLEGLLQGLCDDSPGRDDIGILFVDLDGFKAVNDDHGHQAGDAVLVEVGARIQGAIRGDDTVCRLAGDEFVVVCPEVADASILEEVATRVAGAIASAPVVHAGRGHQVRASVGTAIGPGDRTIAELLHHADAAMYAAKRRQRTSPPNETVDEALRS